MRFILRATTIFALCAPVWAIDLAGLSNADAAGGLKEALTQGAGRAVELLGSNGGFMNNPKVKIGLPDSLAPVEGMLRTMGRGKDLDALVANMNKAAEEAVPQAKAASRVW